MAELPLSGPVKSAVIEVLDKHVADVTADANRIKAAIVADLPGMSETGLSIESMVEAEFAKLKANIKPLWKSWMTYVVVAGAAVAGAAGVALLHFV